MIMPVMDGKEALERIFTLNSEVKVIMTSGYVKDVDISSLKEKGLAGFIIKPFNQGQISKLVAEVIAP